jgi:hypothetical protein
LLGKEAGLARSTRTGAVFFLNDSAIWIGAIAIKHEGRGCYLAVARGLQRGARSVCYICVER